MDEKAFFWEMIENSHPSPGRSWEDYSVDTHIENLTQLLSQRTKEELIYFEKNLRERLHELYISSIAEFYMILNCQFTVDESGRVTFDEYLSDDGFIYFRCWLILNGSEFFSDIIEDINHFNSGKYSCNIGDCWAEGLLYVSNGAYEAAHQDDNDLRDIVSERFPDVMHYDSMERRLDRPLKTGPEIQEAYPEMVEIIVELRS